MRRHTTARPALLLFASFVVMSLAIAAQTGTGANEATRGASPPRPDRSAHGDPAEFEQRDLPVTEQDLQILVRASELLRETSSWNRKDDRDCKDDEAAGTRSLFCALHAASIEILGTYDHRRVALQEMRFAIEEVSKGREFEHRLMDFNNLPETRLDDVHAVLRIARDRVSARLQTPD